MEIKINDLGSIHEAARQFIAQIGEHKVFAFYGNMGAGKTTFVKAIWAINWRAASRMLPKSLILISISFHLSIKCLPHLMTRQTNQIT